jgi:phosphonoacetaldehyde hydrolase
MSVTAVVFDWSGTLVDYGSRAPVAALQDVFATAGVPIEVGEARLSLGVDWRDQIRGILELDRVFEAWEQTRGAVPSEDDIEELYADLLPKQLACLGDYSLVIPGVPAMAEALRARDIRIGSTTGYTREMLDFLIERAQEQGFAPDCAICPEDVPGGGRPYPWMCYLNAIELAVSPMGTMVKIGGTPADMIEGRNAGMWAVGITRTGNEAGLTEEEWDATTAEERTAIVERAEARLMDAGAHYLIESAADCMDVIDDIVERIEAGEKP